MMIQNKNDLINAIIFGLLACFFASQINACTVQIDNPFYSPRSLDVNKVQSKAVNNYLPDKK